MNTLSTNRTKKLVLAALCVALGMILPMAFHAVPNAGGIFLPMHIPVLLCGLVCGWQYGLACGVLAPLLSSLITGMPPAAFLPGMLCELAVYGLVSGL
ncbi:MAG: ECF transporter S component, partial [Ruthenibacterium sp.]